MLEPQFTLGNQTKSCVCHRIERPSSKRRHKLSSDFYVRLKRQITPNWTAFGRGKQYNVQEYMFRNLALPSVSQKFRSKTKAIARLRKKFKGANCRARNYQFDPW